MADAPDILKTAEDEFKTAKQGWEHVYMKAREDLEFLSDEEYAQWVDKTLIETRQQS